MPKDKLKHWPAFARKRLDPHLYANLSAAGGGERLAKTWYLSFQPIPPDQFARVEIRGEDDLWHPYPTDAT